MLYRFHNHTQTMHGRPQKGSDSITQATLDTFTLLLIRIIIQTSENISFLTHLDSRDFWHTTEAEYRLLVILNGIYWKLFVSTLLGLQKHDYRI